MRPNLSIVTLCALLLAASACTPENADTTDDCPDASCDWQLEDAAGEDTDLLPDAGPDASDADADAPYDMPDWRPQDPPPRPERDVLIEVIWERLDPVDEDASPYINSYTDLDLFYCHALDGLHALNTDSGCTSYRNRRAGFNPTPDGERMETEMQLDSHFVDYPEWVVHDHPTAGRTHLVVQGYSVQFAVRAHARVYLDGELAWENSVEFTPEVSKAIWYAGTIDWHEDPAHVTITDGPSCAESNSDDACHDVNDALYLRDVTFAEAP
ncbi:hypothetical protein DV096_19540 [Bradymonadaceae bacterium TMQ3]|nr:hypothetical protein DV096_19540 [Bradymonadaceae bacterium TMQ3]TXC68498.1 hypothetical protein FRC91_19325 [Bradymonadales bacterium TMQ1]